MFTRVAIVETDHALLQNWIRCLGRSAEYRCVCGCATAEEALTRIPKVNPHVILVDINLSGMSGIECTARLKRLIPRAQILMLTVAPDFTPILQSLRAGAVGYVLKGAPLDEILAAVQDALHGGSPMASGIARKLVETFHRTASPVVHENGLSVREEEVLDLLAQGLSNKEIAGRLRISFDTVRTHLKHVYEKLQVRSRAEAVGRYLRPLPKSIDEVERSDDRRSGAVNAAR
jgi:DNA-binding NarL/FixJ family response regulator